MNATRLSHFAPEIEALLAQAQPAKRHAVCLAALDQAMRDTQTSDPLIILVLERIRKDEIVPPQELSAVQNRVDELEDEYGHLRLAFEERHEGSLEGYTEVFRRFMAATAVATAAREGTSSSAIGDVIADAAGAVNDDDDLIASLSSLLR